MMDDAIREAIIEQRDFDFLGTLHADCSRLRHAFYLISKQMHEALLGEIVK